MSLTLTNLYLEDSQRSFLSQRAKSAKTNLSVEVRRAIDAYQAGVDLDEIKLLDAATRQAETELAAANATLDRGLARAEVFFAEIERIKAESAASAGA